MKLSVSYTANDYAEAQAAGIAVLTEEARKTPNGKRPGDLRPGDMITIVLCLLLLIGATYFVAETPRNPHAISRPNMDLIQTVAIASMLPLFISGMIAVEFVRKSAAVTGVPFYSVKPPRTGPPPWIPRLLVGLMYTLFVVAGIVLGRPHNANWRPSFEGLIAVLVGPWLACLFILYFGLGVWQASRRQKLQNNSATVGTTPPVTKFFEFGGDGMLFGDSLASSQLAWANFVSYLESTNLLLLYTRTETYYIIPKRAFSDSAEFEQLCNLIQEKIPAGRLHPKPVSV